MYQYYYYYEAFFIGGDISLRLSPNYIAFMGAIVWLAIFAAFGLVLFSAIANKKARVLGCITAVFAPLGIYAAHQSVVNYAALDFSFMGTIKATSTVSQSDAISKLYEMLAEEFIERIVSHPAFLAYLFWAVVLGISTIVTLVYAILLIKSRRGRGLAVGAMVAIIVKFILIGPMQSITTLANAANLDLTDIYGPLAADIQLFWEFLFYAATLLPLLLIGIQALLCLVNKKKDDAADAAKAEAATIAQAQVDVNINYNPNQNYNPNVNYNPNQNYNPNVNYNPNQNYNPNVTYNPNQNYNPNVTYNPNQNYNPNVTYDPNLNYNPNVPNNNNQNPQG